LPHIVQNLKAQAWSDEVNNYVLHKFSCWKSTCWI
jgi:hypothetical protein